MFIVYEFLLIYNQKNGLSSLVCSDSTSWRKSQPPATPCQQTSTLMQICEFFGDCEFNYRAQRFLKMNSKSSSLAINNVKCMSFLVIQPLSSELSMAKKSLRESMLPTWWSSVGKVAWLLLVKVPNTEKAKELRVTRESVFQHIIAMLRGNFYKFLYGQQKNLIIRICVLFFCPA